MNLCTSASVDVASNWWVKTLPPTRRIWQWVCACVTVCAVYTTMVYMCALWHVSLSSPIMWYNTYFIIICSFFIYSLMSELLYRLQATHATVESWDTWSRQEVYSFFVAGEPLCWVGTLWAGCWLEEAVACFCCSSLAFCSARSLAICSRTRCLHQMDTCTQALLIKLRVRALLCQPVLLFLSFLFFRNFLCFLELHSKNILCTGYTATSSSLTSA